MSTMAIAMFKKIYRYHETKPIPLTLFLSNPLQKPSYSDHPNLFTARHEILLVLNASNGYL